MVFFVCFEYLGVGCAEDCSILEKGSQNRTPARSTNASCISTKTRACKAPRMLMLPHNQAAKLSMDIQRFKKGSVGILFATRPAVACVAQRS